MVMKCNWKLKFNQKYNFPLDDRELDLCRMEVIKQYVNMNTFKFSNKVEKKIRCKYINHFSLTSMSFIFPTNQIYRPFVIVFNY